MYKIIVLLFLFSCGKQNNEAKDFYNSNKNNVNLYKHTKNLCNVQIVQLAKKAFLIADYNGNIYRMKKLDNTYFIDTSKVDYKSKKLSSLKKKRFVEAYSIAKQLDIYSVSFECALNYSFIEFRLTPESSIYFVPEPKKLITSKHAWIINKSTMYDSNWYVPKS